MRPLILIVGIIIIAAGVVPLEVPLDPHSGKNFTTTTPATFHVKESIQVLADEPVSASWTSNVSVTIVARTCSSANLTASPIWAQCTGGSNITQTGTSGTVSTSVPVGGYLWVVILSSSSSGGSPSASLTVSTSLPSVAVALWAFGGLVVVVGVLMRRRKKPAPAVETGPAAAAPSGPAGPAAEPTEARAPRPSVPEEEFGEEPLD